MPFDLSTARPANQGFDPSTARPAEESMLSRAKDAFTGKSRMTPEMGSLQEIGAAPELNELSVPAFKASLGLLSTGDTKSLQGILRSQLGDKASFREDEKGNVIVSLPSGEYALNRPGFSPQDAVRTTFDVLSFVPAGRASSILGAGVKAAGTEAIREGVESGLGGQDIRPGSIALTGVIGAAGKAVEKAAGVGYRYVKGRRAANPIVQAGDEAGIPVLTSDVLPPQTFPGRIAQQTAEKIPLAGTAGVREGQQELRKKAVQEFADKYGEFSYSSIVDSLRAQKDRIKQAAGNVLNKTGQQLDDIGEIPLTNTKGAAQAVKDELSRPGIIQSTEAIDDLQKLINTLDEAPQNFTTLKENRTAFREIVRAADKAERSQLTSRAKSLLERVESGMTKDMEAFARQNLGADDFAKWRRANAVYAQEARNLTKSKLKTVLDKGDITPESVKQMLFSQSPSDVRLLYNSLTASGRQHARSAIISKAVNDISRRQAGFTPNSFATELKKYGIQTDTFFKGMEKKQLQGLLKALEATRRAQDAAVTTPTGQQLIGGLSITGLYLDPVSALGTAGTVGGLARLYESAPVRNALLRLASVPQGSTQFEQALQQFQTALTSGAQAMRSAQEDREPPP